MYNTLCIYGPLIWRGKNLARPLQWASVCRIANTLSLLFCSCTNVTVMTSSNACVWNKLGNLLFSYWLVVGVILNMWFNHNHVLIPVYADPWYFLLAYHGTHTIFMKVDTELSVSVEIMYLSLLIHLKNGHCDQSCTLTGSLPYPPGKWRNLYDTWN